MLRVTLWALGFVHLGLAVLLAVLLSLGLLILEGQRASATSLVSTSDIPVEEIVSDADPSRTHAEIKFMYDNWIIDAGQRGLDEQTPVVRPPESEASTVWPGIRDLDLLLEPSLHHLAPPEDNPKATNILTHPWGGDALSPDY
jgi:hypothetical protein